jgi:hypothetical protein
VAVTDDSGTFVTLSHFCPTAAAMLFDSELELSVVEAPVSFHSVREYEGLDARGALPPLLRPGMLMDLTSHHAWERHVVRVFGDPMHTPETALEQLARDAEALRGWQPGDRPLTHRVSGFAGLREDATESPSSMDVLFRPATHFHEMVRSCVPAGLETDPAPADCDRVDAVLVEPAWAGFAAPIRRYLCAKAFASWTPWHGQGVRSTIAALAAARAVLRVEAGRQCARAGRMLDRSLLIEAIRRADLLLVHMASSEALAARLAAVELDAYGAAAPNRIRRGVLCDPQADG